MMEKSQLLQYKHDNITIYHEKCFILNYMEEQDSLRIIHEKDTYFRAVINNDTLLDCVLAIIINFHETLRNQTIFEIGLNHTNSGFMAQLVPHKNEHVIFLEQYTQEEHESFELV